MKSLAARFLLPFGLLAVLLFVFVLYRTYVVSRQHANELVSQQVALALEFNLAIRDYAADKIRPAMENLVGQDRFNPETMSTSYISRSIFERVRMKFPDYVIRFSSENPRNPSNIANEDELKMIRYFRENPLIERRTEEIEISGRKYLAHFTPKRITSDCLRCHGDPADAPAEMVKRYGPKGSFYRKLGDVAGLDTIAAPVEKINAGLASEMRRQSLIFLTGLALLLGLIMATFHLVVARRLSAISAHFQEISSLSESKGMTPVKVTGNDEIGLLGSAFNKLVEQLRAAHTSLEERIMQRTTELRQANELLRDREARLKKSQEIAQLGSWELDLTTNHLIWSDEVYRIFGLRPEEFGATYEAVLDTIHPDDRAAVNNAYLSSLNECRDSYEIQHRVVRKDTGDIRFVHERCEHVRDASGKIVRSVGMVQDITERKRVEESLQKSEERFRLAYSTSPDAININRLSDGLYVDINEGFTRLTGFTRDDVIGRTSLEMNIWSNPADRQKLVDELKDKGYCENLEAEFRRKDGSVTTALMSANIIVLQDIPHILSVTRDISDRKRAEEEKTRLEGQLQQAQKMESIGRLAGGVAHDFNNMLGVILGRAEMALGKVDPSDPLHTDLEEIRKAAGRSADLTRQLLAFARKQTVTPKVLDLTETISGMLKMLQRLIGENIVLEWQPRADLWPVRMDPSQIDQILANLFVNARDAISGVGRITIETGNRTLGGDFCSTHTGCVPGDYVLLGVSDSGCGMDKETLSHLFEPFFTTKGIGKGTGLGMAMIYGIIKQNNGFINVDSEPGQGTICTIYLPRHMGKAGQAQPGEAAKPALRGRETILLVEDEPAILDMTAAMLELQGYTVVAASTPGEAIRVAREHAGEIHLLMTDVVMPEMNGRDLAKNLLDLYPHLKRMFMSGYTADVIAHHGVLDDGVCFIQKPFTMKDLGARVREALDSE